MAFLISVKVRSAICSDICGERGSCLGYREGNICPNPAAGRHSWRAHVPGYGRGSHAHRDGRPCSLCGGPRLFRSRQSSRFGRLHDFGALWDLRGDIAPGSEDSPYGFSGSAESAVTGPAGQGARRRPGAGTTATWLMVWTAGLNGSVPASSRGDFAWIIVFWRLPAFQPSRVLLAPIQ